MSQLLFNKDDFEIIVEPYVCSFHVKNPGEYFAGCSCCSGFGMMPKNHKKFAEENQPHPYDVLSDLLVDDID